MNPEQKAFERLVKEYGSILEYHRRELEVVGAQALLQKAFLVEFSRNCTLAAASAYKILMDTAHLPVEVWDRLFGDAPQEWRQGSNITVVVAAYNVMSGAFARLGEPDLAERLADSAMAFALGPELEGAVLVHRAEARALRGKFPEALEDLQGVDERFIDKVPFEYNMLLAVVNNGLGAFEKGEKAARKVIDANPLHPVGYALLGDAKRGMRDKGPAMDNYAKALEMGKEVPGSLLTIDFALGAIRAERGIHAMHPQLDISFEASFIKRGILTPEQIDYFLGPPLDSR